MGTEVTIEVGDGVGGKGVIVVVRGGWDAFCGGLVRAG